MGNDSETNREVITSKRTLEDEVQMILKYRIPKRPRTIRDEYERPEEVGQVPPEQVRVDPVRVVRGAPRFGYSHDGTRLPRFPPSRNLRDMILECGLPFEKQLTATDVTDSQNRILLKREDVEHGFHPLLRYEENPRDGVEVTFYDIYGRDYKGNYKLWAGEKMHVLNGGWKTLYRANNFRAVEDYVSFWMFRHRETEKLCVAIVPKR